MTLLICGVVLWSAVHLFPSTLPGTRSALIERLGNNTYRGLFSLDVVIALVLIVVGWRSANVQAVYVPVAYGSPVVPVLMFLSFVLFAAANAPGNIRRYLRHPMLTGVIVWGIAHLLANGDNRSIALFGGMALWAVISIVTINRREDEWQRPEPVAISKDIVTIVASAAVFGVVAWGHRWVFGVSALPGG